MPWEKMKAGSAHSEAAAPAIRFSIKAARLNAPAMELMGIKRGGHLEVYVEEELRQIGFVPVERLTADSLKVTKACTLRRVATMLRNLNVPAGDYPVVECGCEGPRGIRIPFAANFPGGRA